MRIAQNPHYARQKDDFEEMGRSPMHLQDFGFNEDPGRGGRASRGPAPLDNRFGPMNDIDDGFGRPAREPRSRGIHPQVPNLRGSPFPQDPRGRRHGTRNRGARHDSILDPMMPARGRRHPDEEVEFGDNGEIDDFEEGPYGPDPHGRTRGGAPGDV